MSLAEILANAQSADASTREQAYAIIQEQKKVNLSGLLQELSSLLCSESPTYSRQLAGILIKNILSNATQEPGQDNLWETIPAEHKLNVRQNVLGALATPDSGVRRSAAQAVATIAKEDFVRNEWLDLIEVLHVNASSVVKEFRIASLMTLGLICEDLPDNILSPVQVNQILTVIAAGVGDEDLEVKTTSLKALKNCLVFASQNFAVEHERTLLFQLVSQNCIHSEEAVRLESFMVLCELASKYYDYLHFFMAEITSLTFQIATNDCERVGVLAIEVWNIIADIELNRQEVLVAQKLVRDYILASGSKLVEMLLANIRRVEEDSEGWTISKACASTLSSVVQLTRDKFVQLPLQFVTENIVLDSAQKKAACLVLGCILEGPNPTHLQDALRACIPSVLVCLQDSVQTVRESAAWALAKICELHYKVVIQPNHFNELVLTLCHLLTLEPSTACHSCWALINLIDHSAEIKLFKQQVFDHVIKALFQATQRTDALGSEHNLQLAAFSAIATLVEKSAEECIPSIVASIDGFTKLLAQATSENMQNAVCSVLQASFSRALSTDVPDELAQNFMQTVIGIFNGKGEPTEEGLQAIGALAICIEERFMIFLPALGGYLAYALNKVDAVPLCKAAVMLIGDIARSLKEASVAHVDDLVAPMLSILVNQEVSGELKVHSIESLADVATYARTSFNKFLPQVKDIIESASQLTLQEVKKEHNPDLWEYLRNLREAIVQFYEGFVQGQLSAGNLEGLFPFVPKILEYVLTVGQSKYMSSGPVTIACIGIIGDIAGAYKQQVKELVRTPQVFTYLQLHRTSSNMKIRGVATWSFNNVNSI